MKNLKYRVYSVSSQNQQFPARNLQDASGIWQSQHNCTYPQQLTLQFFVPIQTKSMKIMFHQYKIPKLIQLFIKCRKQQKYRKLGLIQPNDNTQSNFLQKQIKTVFFQFPCTFVKLIIHQNYRNQMNLFDQIAINEINFQGEILPTSEYKNLDINILDSLDTSSEDSQLQLQSNHSQNKQLFPRLQKKPTQNFTSILYPQIFQKLQMIKLQAVQKQQFQKAQYIKNTILNFQQMQKQILKLQQFKKIALNQQDYDKCHKLKIQITRKRQNISCQIREFQNQIIENNQLIFSRVNQAQQQNRANANYRQNMLENQDKLQKTPAINRNISPNNVNTMQQYDSQIVPALRKKKNIQQSYMSSVAKQNQSILDTVRSPKTQKKQQFQQVQQSVDLRTYNLNNLYEQFPKLQKLQLKNQKKYQQFFNYIPQHLWRIILSQQYQKQWKLKSKALDQVSNLQIIQGRDLIGVMQFVSITISDKHTIIIKKSLQILQKIINLPNKDIWCDPNYPRYFIDNILLTLIQLMNDTKQQFRKMAIQIYKNLPQFSLVYLQTAIRILIKSSSSSLSSKNKRKINPRVQLSKLSIIQYYLSTFTDVIHHITQIIKWLIQCTNDNNTDIKNIAMQMLLDIGRMDKQLYNRIKKDMEKYDKDIWNSYQIQYNVLMNQIQNSRLSEKNNSIQVAGYQDNSDIYKKQTVKNKDKNLQKNSSNNSIHQSNIHNSNTNNINPHNINNIIINQQQYSIHKTNKQNSQIQLAYSQQSISQNLKQQQSHDWFTNNNSNNQFIINSDNQYYYNYSSNQKNNNINLNNNVSNININTNKNINNNINNNSSHTYTNNNSSYVSNNNKNNQQIRVMQPYQQQLQGMCDYCFRKYDGTTLSQHLLKYCPAVLTCRYCKGAIYIRQYTQHLLTSCVKKHQQCPRCLLAYQFDQVNQHIARKICRKYRINMERCSFCQEDIEPDDVSWVEHCQKCQKIIRRNNGDEDYVYTENSEHMATDR